MKIHKMSHKIRKGCTAHQKLNKPQKIIKEATIIRKGSVYARNTFPWDALTILLILVLGAATVPTPKGSTVHTYFHISDYENPSLIYKIS